MRVRIGDRLKFKNHSLGEVLVVSASSTHYLLVDNRGFRFCEMTKVPNGTSIGNDEFEVSTGGIEVSHIKRRDCSTWEAVWVNVVFAESVLQLIPDVYIGTYKVEKKADGVYVGCQKITPDKIELVETILGEGGSITLGGKAITRADVDLIKKLAK